jgi:RNA polymerase sigma-70 factor (ECF subfamily)
MVYDQVEEKELIELAKEGSHAAFEELIERNHKKIFKSVYVFSKSCQDTEDVLQQTWIKAWKNMGRFKEKSSFSTWLYRIAKNNFFDLMRKYKSRKVVFSDDLEAIESISMKDGHLSNDAISNPSESLEDKEATRKIRSLIDSLPKDHKEVITLLIDKDMSYKGIAEKVKIPIGTVMSRIFYAKKQLRKKVKNLNGYDAKTKD